MSGSHSHRNAEAGRLRAGTPGALVANAYHEAANLIACLAPADAETPVALRKLLESRDAAFRAIGRAVAEAVDKVAFE